ncbi:PBECR2 nuclease fold domain-containing protein [Ruminococcus sp. LCP21S3_E8]
MDKLYKAGEYIDKYNQILNINLPCTTIYVSRGLRKHIQARHTEFVSYISKIPEIIKSPDYIGKNPKEPNSIELVKVYNDNIQIGIKLDTNKNYLYVATLFDIKTGKIQRRLNSGRLKRL